MTNAAAYIRVSSGMQVETGASLPSQLAEIRAYCVKNNLELLEEHIYTDAGESARTDDRPAFQAMIAAARRRPAPFSVIVCWENSRFARSREDAITYKALLKKQKVDLRFVKQDFDATPMGSFMEGIVELVDEWYSKNLAVETRRGLIENARQGYSGGGTPPYGMRRVAKINEFGKEKATREPDPETAPIVREIFEMRAEKEMGYRAIAYALNARGIRSPKGSAWNSNTIYYMLTKNQPAYLGHLVFNRADYKTLGRKEKPEDEWIVVENVWPAIITMELAEKVNALTRRREPGFPGGTQRKDTEEPFVLTGKVICGICGGAVSGVTSGRKGRYRYYRCNKSRDAGPHSCSMPQIPQRKIEDAVMKVFSEQIVTDGLLEEMIEVIKEGREARNKSESERTMALEKNLADLEKRKRNLTLAVEEGAMSFSDVKERISELNQQIGVLKKDLDKTKAELTPIPPAKKWNLAKFRKQLMLFMELERPIALKSIMESFVRCVTVYPDEICINLVLAFPGKSNVQAPLKIRPARQRKTASEQSESGFTGCKSNVGAEDET